AGPKRSCATRSASACSACLLPRDSTRASPSPSFAPRRPPQHESASDENGRSVQVNLALSDEQVLLREAARGALSRFKTLEAAREALDGNEDALPDLWPPAKEAGWPGLLIDEEHGGAGLDAFDAMLVLGECGRVLAGVPLMGHLPATAILNDAPAAAPLLEALATGERRAAYLPVCPPDDMHEQWSVDPASGLERPGAPTAVRAESENGQGEQARVSGELSFVPDAPGADVPVGGGLLARRRVRG